MDLLVGLFSALVALCHWRLVVCLAAGLLAAVVLAQQISWFTGGMGLWMVLLALSIGMLWHGDAFAGATPAAVSSAAVAGERPRGERISRPFAALGLCLTGMVWGGLLGMGAGSLWAGAAVLAAATFAVGLFWAWRSPRPVPWGYMAFAGCALLSGPGGIWVLAEIAGRG
ncbi:hypothetical protein [Acidovorax sp.]|uniref:hypothetical protein n=1 Tax=Acidovorax sp. TaxID=1872122 RepID=UPI00391F2461